MPPATREQRTSLFKVIKKRVKYTNIDDGIASTLIDVAENVIEFYPIDDDDEMIPEAQSVINLIQEYLPPPRQVLSKELLEQAMFPVITLRMVGKLYGFEDPDEQWLTAAALDAVDLQSPKIMSLVWLCWILQCIPEFAVNFIKLFKELNGSPTEIIPEARLGAIAAQRDAQDMNRRPVPQEDYGGPNDPQPMRAEDDQGEKRRGINMSRDKNNNIVVKISEDGANIPEKTGRKGDQEDNSRNLNAVINSFRDCQFKGFD